jgi:hypothetical protein
MQIPTKLTSIFRNTPDLVRRFSFLSSRKDTAVLADNLRRELYGMNMREQAAVMQVMSQPGQAVTVREPTIAFGKKSTVFLLEKGSHLQISKHPLHLDEDGNVQVILLNQSNKHLFLRLSDYITAIHVNQ